MKDRKSYNLVLTFKLPYSKKGEDYIDALYEAGYSEALIGIGKEGYISLDIDKEASSKKLAILSIIEDIKKVIPGITFVKQGE